MTSVKKDGREDRGDGGSHDPPAVQPNRMAEALEKGGILGWGSYLTFAWAGPFLKLGSTVTLTVDHLEGIYKTYKRYIRYVNLVVWYPLAPRQSAGKGKKIESDPRQAAEDHARQSRLLTVFCMSGTGTCSPRVGRHSP